MDAEPPLIRWQTVDRLHHILARCAQTDTQWPLVYPSADGGVHLEWRSVGNDIEVELLNTGEVTLFTVATSILEDFSEFDAKRIVQQVAGELNTWRIPKGAGAASPNAE